MEASDGSLISRSRVRKIEEFLARAQKPVEPRLRSYFEDLESALAILKEVEREDPSVTTEADWRLGFSLSDAAIDRMLRARTDEVRLREDGHAGPGRFRP